MSGKRRLHWGLPESPMPKHPVRDTILVYAGLALIVVLVSWLTGGSVGRAAVIAGFFFVAATGWNLTRWRQKMRDDARRPDA
jgi:Flp pilus assembly protein TadB